MKDTAENNTEEHDKAIERLISKMFLDPMLVEQERVEARADIFDTSWKEYIDFTLSSKKICSPDMWVISERPGTLVHEWKNTYSVGPTKVLGNLACILTYKSIGIGSAERH